MATKKLPSSPCKWTSFPNPLKRIYEVIGAKGSTIPKAAHGEWKIDGWQIVVKRSGPFAKGGRPRIFVRHEGRLVPAGRVRQALCRLKVHQERKRAIRTRGAKGQFIYRDRSKPRSWITPSTTWAADQGELVPQFRLTADDQPKRKRLRR